MPMSIDKTYLHWGSIGYPFLESVFQGFIGVLWDFTIRRNAQKNLQHLMGSRGVYYWEKLGTDLQTPRQLVFRY